MIAVITAHRDGKQIQHRSLRNLNPQWMDVLHNRPFWAFEQSEYRIKPEPPPKPREWKIRIDKYGGISTSEYPEAGETIVHVREVFEQEAGK